jgi:aromatic-L-amino-acid decarboxylase
MDPRPPPTDAPGLDPADWEELRAVGHRMVDDMVGYLAGVRERPVWQPVPDAVKRSLAEALPKAPQSLDAVYRRFSTEVLPYPAGNIHPRFWGWVKGSGVPSAAFAELLAACMNANAGGFDQSPSHVELTVIDWMKQIVGFPMEASGVLVSGASMANLIGLTVARDSLGGPNVREQGLSGHTARLMVYTSSEAHSCMRKAVELLGMGTRSLALIPVRDDYTMDLDALRARLADDRARGHRPIAIVASAGTVNTGAIDPIAALADLAEEQGLWLHVDGAIGAVACISPVVKARLAGIERADSIGFDLHKWLYMPYEVGCVLVRDRARHKASFHVAPSYLARLAGGVANGPVAWADYGLQLSRGFKALKVWFALHNHGAARFAAAIEGNLAQAQHLAALVDEHPQLERLAPVPLNIVNYRYTHPGVTGDALDELNQRILIRLQEEGIAVPSSTVLGGRFAIRVAITNHRSTPADFDLLVRETVRIGDELSRQT